MRQTYEPQPNWGCFIAFLIAVPFLSIVFFGAMMGGGGCEGRDSPCNGDYRPMWLAFLLVIAVALTVGWLINKLVAWLRARSAVDED